LFGFVSGPVFPLIFLNHTHFLSFMALNGCKYFYNGARKKLGLPGRKFPINPYFSDIAEDIETLALESRLLKYSNEYATTKKSRGKYGSRKSKKLLNFCRAHLHEHGRPIDGKEHVPLGVHTWFGYLYDWDRIEKQSQQIEKPSKGPDARNLNRVVHNYVNALFDTLEVFSQNPNCGSLLFEMPEHYAAATSLFVEQGLFDLAHFSVWDEGTMLRKSEFRDLADAKRIYIIGGYTNACLLGHLRDLRLAFPKKDIILLPELTLSAPKKRERFVRETKLHPNLAKITGGRFGRNSNLDYKWFGGLFTDTMSLEEFLASTNGKA
jgi:hypothetical protein